jgi:hypothetical protein
MIQRILYRALSAGLEYFQQNPDAFDQLFGDNYGLSDTEIAAIKTFFQQKPPKVFHGYARSDQTPPFYAIVLADEREVDSVLGDEAGIISDEEDEDFGADQYTAFWSHTYHILCVAEHPEAAQYIYEVAKTIILGAKPTLIPEGIYDSQVSGSELAPDPRFIPEHWFVRQLTFSARRELLTVKKGSEAGKAWKVAGIHVDKEGSPSDVGGVKTLIKPVAGGEDE